KERSERAARIKAYWEAHPEEKAALEAKKADLTGKKTALEEKIAAVDEQIDALKAERDAKTATELVIDDINAKIRALEIQRSNLGIFAGKEKKRIDAEVLELRAQIQGHLPKVDAEKKERADAFAAKAAPFNEEKGKLTQELEALNKEIDAVSEELTKDRN
ncbi:MAG: hypothetical protein IKY44_05430, partial [Clostridia bacterium]|nr:hypothetical protein [Clostridia bacterium]